MRSPTRGPSASTRGAPARASCSRSLTTERGSRRRTSRRSSIRSSPPSRGDAEPASDSPSPTPSSASTAESAEEAFDLLRGRPFDVILLDLMLPGLGGMEALERIRARSPDQTVVMMTAFASVESAVEAMKIGAFHYLTKPFKNDEVLLLVEKALERRQLVDENRRLKRVLLDRHSFERLVGKSRPMREIFRLIDQVAPSRSTVLVQGESGTGKELIAHALHARSPRAELPFVVVNSNSIPPDLLESNLFGHVKGAFTGATHHKKGLFEVADG